MESKIAGSHYKGPARCRTKSSIRGFQIGVPFEAATLELQASGSEEQPLETSCKFLPRLFAALGVLVPKLRAGLRLGHVGYKPRCKAGFQIQCLTPRRLRRDTGALPRVHVKAWALHLPLLVSQSRTFSTLKPRT